MKKIITTLIILSLIGVAISTYSFLHNKGFVSGEICVIGESLDCDVVNQGPYSKLFGIPVSLIGIIGYAFLFVGSVMKRNDQKDEGLTRFLLLASLGGLLFSFYLSGIEAFILQTWCLVCLISQLVILLITILAGKVYLLEKKSEK